MTDSRLKKAKFARSICVSEMEALMTLASTAKADTSKHKLFKTRFAEIDDLREEFNKQHQTLVMGLLADDKSDITAEETIRSKFQDDFFIVKTIFSDLFETEEGGFTSSSRRSSLFPHSPNIKLPEIKIGKFNGDFTKFPTFLDLFDALVHHNQNLSEIEKFNYLVSSLEGQPLSLVRTLPMVRDNYAIAYDSLVQRYSNKRLRAQAHWDALENLGKVNSNNANALRLLLDTFSEHLAALKHMQFPVEEWDFILVQMLFKRMDNSLITRFELEHGSTAIPTYSSVVNFLKKYCCAIESLKSSTTSDNHNKSLTPQKSSSYNKRVNSLFSNVGKDGVITCCLCKESHQLFACPKFLKKSPKERHTFCKNTRLCFNCLSAVHNLRNCKSLHTCRECKLRHHTLLHLGSDNCSSSNVVSESSLNTDDNQPSSVISATGVVKRTTTILLATALIEVCDRHGNFHIMRALIDSGSMMSFISKRASTLLGLPKNRIGVKIQTLNSLETSSNDGCITLSMRPVGQYEPVFITEACILNKISDELPRNRILSTAFSHLRHLKLADPHFHEPGNIDLLLGADIFSKIVLGEVIHGESSGLDAINTKLGYIVMGQIASQSNASTFSFFVSSPDQKLYQDLQRLWELEGLPSLPESLCQDDDLCETIYRMSHKRDDNGRYMVSLPFRDGLPTFSGSRDIAVSRFKNLESRLLKQPQMYSLYRDFMQEYLSAGHMTPIEKDSIPPHSYYLPHHGVVKGEGNSSKIRVVFNASSKCSSQLSLNDTLLTGRKLQKDILSILLRFRVHEYVISADVRQMYRMIWVNPEHQDYQRIVWRFSPDEDIQDFRLKTVTYGVSSAPFLALRTMKQLILDEGKNFPLAVQALEQDTYIDDVVSGCKTIEEVRKLKSQLISLLMLGGFELRKFSSNNFHILDDLPTSHLSLNEKSFDSDEEDASLRILGMQWHPSTDSFRFSVRIINRRCTKRHLLSELAKIYDPIGFLGPVTFLLKLLIQRIWAVGIGWDDEPPADIFRLWDRYKAEIAQLSEFKIARKLFEGSFDAKYELHGFCDASEKGYCAVIYVRVIYEERICCQFLCSKTKIAPLKKITIPRLELCAAALLANLLLYFMETLQGQIAFSGMFAWSDSQIALSWIQGQPHRWPIFVANRVSAIKSKIPHAKWGYIPTKDNPADAGSRGLLPSEFIKNELWFRGPNILWKELTFHEFSEFFEGEVAIEPLSFIVTQPPKDEFYNLTEKFSSLSKLIRSVSFVLRFMHNLSHPKSQRRFGWLSTSELNDALLTLVKSTQSVEFFQELRSKTFSKTLRRLNAFIDDDGILRVGGRLRHSALNYEAKYPILLPCKSSLTTLVIRFYHEKYLHAGRRTLTFLLAQRFWIISAKRAIFSYISKCTRCCRSNPRPLQPPMADLPHFRVSQLKAFSHVGVDYAGPYSVSMSRHRGVKTTKAYICLFVCCSTKAVHLELASDLSSETFLAALQRFISRRGCCKHIYSDCGTNFVGAYREINNFMRDAACREHIQWHFNPPSAPHMGGLWEAGVKSVKAHLKRVLGEQLLSYEEFSTLLCLIEAILNSRPLTSVSSDPEDVTVLTPGHFLTLEPLSCLPVPDLADLSINRLSRWQLLQKLHQSFWTRWSKEYLHTLQQRSKWLSCTAPPEVGTLVLIKDDNNPPCRWSTGRIIAFYPGTDNVPRVASVKTAKGVLDRPLVKLCPLPS